MSATDGGTDLLSAPPKPVDLAAIDRELALLWKTPVAPRDDRAPIARSLLLGDLPTSLWWASHEPPPLGGSLFGELEAMTDQVVYSSLSWHDPVRGTLATAAWAAEVDSTIEIADLAWRRLKPWRIL